jgi:hypothetical protein
MKNLYNWALKISSFPFTPIEVIHIECITNDKVSVFSTFPSSCNSGWGGEYSFLTKGEAFKPIPDTINATWFSYVEKKFYTANVKLPVDKLTKLFKEGYKDVYTGEMLTYDNVIVGMSARGKGCIWISGGGTWQHEIMHFTGKPIELKQEDVPEIYHHLFKHDYIATFTDKLTTEEKDNALHIVEKGVIEHISKTYAITPMVTKLHNDIQPQSIQLHYINEAREAYGVDTINNIPEHPRTFPLGASITWQQGDREYSAGFEFNEEELREAMQQVLEASSKKILYIDFRISKLNELTVHIQSTEFDYRLMQCDIEVYSAKK